MKSPPASDAPLRGDQVFRDDGYSYLPRFITADETAQLAAFFAELHPLWESRHAPGQTRRRGGTGRLTRPVYWLGAWQFAALGYYSEPDHLHNRCVRAEPLPPIMTTILERLRDELTAHGDTGPLPNTCLINFYGREPGQPPVDYARLRMHRDAEPGPVVMFSVGQPAQFEFLDPEASQVAHAQWVRNRSVVILSGAEYKDTLYHRVTRVRYGQDPVLTAQLDHFEIRRISVSFRHVPERYIRDLGEMSPDAQAIATPYVTELSAYSQHFARQLQTVSRESTTRR